jgi:hypothetical protein
MNNKELRNSGNESETPRTDACPRCNGNRMPFKEGDGKVIYYTCGSYGAPEGRFYQDVLCEARQELAASQAEVERLQTLPESRHKAFLDLLERCEKAQAEVKEIRAALGDDGRRTHKELIELATKAAEWRTWKEKYIDLKNAHIAEGQDPAGTIWEHADKLQRELAASKAEVERQRFMAGELRELLSNLCSALLHRMFGDEPTGKEVVALLNAYRAADEFLQPNSLQSKPLTASHA